MKNTRDILNEVKIIKAKSLIEIHSSAMEAWYIHKNRLLSNTGKLIRRPHRMVYDHLSALLNFTTTENLIEYFTHLISSEKSYGMFTVILEYSSTDEQILTNLRQLTDCVLIAHNDNGQSFLELVKLQNFKFKPLKIDI